MCVCEVKFLGLKLKPSSVTEVKVNLIRISKYGESRTLQARGVVCCKMMLAPKEDKQSLKLA